MPTFHTTTSFAMSKLFAALALLFFTCTCAFAATSEPESDPGLSAMAPLSACESSMLKAGYAWLVRESGAAGPKSDDKTVFTRMISDARAFAPEQLAQARATLATGLAEFDARLKAGQASAEDQTLLGFLTLASDFLACHPLASK